MDIGQLTGEVAIEDQFSSTFELIVHAAERFGENFEGALGGIAIGVGVVTTAVGALTAAVTALAVRGSDVNDVTATFEHFAERAGGADAVLRSLRAGVQDTVDEMVLMKDASRILSAGVKLTAEDFNTLTSAAFVLQNRGLGTTEQMLNMVTSAMVTGRTRTLAMSLGVVDAADATQKYAESLGLSVSQLTEAQQAEARRIAVMGMLRDAVKDAGDQQLDFAEKIERVEAQWSTWLDNLASAVAASPHVTAAFDAIVDSLSQFGNGSEMIETVVGWVNKFADVVIAYGPSIISTLVGIKNWISAIWTAVTDAWDTVPDWLKSIAKEAIVAGAGFYLVSTGLKNLSVGFTGAADAGSDLLDVVSQSATITDASISVGKLATEIRGVRTAIADGAEALGLTQVFSAVGGGTVTLTTLAGKITLVTTVITTAIAVGTALYQVWKLHGESGERAAAAMRQQEVDGRNLAILNSKLGTSFKDVNEASAEWIRRNKDTKPAVNEHAAALAALAARQKAYDGSVQAVVDSVRKSVQELNVNRDAFERLGDQVLFTKAAQDQFTAAMDNYIESGRALTAEESQRYDFIVRDRQAMREHGEETLRSKGVTIELIEAQRTLGETEAEMAKRWGTTTNALRAYETEMTSLRTLTNEVRDLELQAAGRVAEAVENARQRERDAAIRAFHGTADELAAFVALWDEKNALIKQTSSSTWQEVEKSSISALTAERDEAIATFNAMIASGNFWREDIDKQRDKIDELTEKIRNHGQVVTATNKDIANSITILTSHWVTEDEVASAALNRQTIMVRTLAGEVISLAEAQARQRAGNSMTYDLSTKEGMEQFRRMNPMAWIGADTTYFLTHTLQEAIQAGLVDLYAGFGSPRRRGGGAASTESAAAAVTGTGTARPTEATAPEVVTTSVGGSVAPRGFAGGIQMTFHVNGTAEETAEKIARIFVDRLGLRSQFGGFR